MLRFFNKVCDNLPSIGGASGAIVDVTTRHTIFNDISEFLVYCGYCIVGALVGYAVKSILDLCNANRRIAKLKKFINDFDRKHEKQNKAKTQQQKLKLLEEENYYDVNE
jgi:hypothetical protein